MSDQFFYGNFFLEETPVALTMMVLYLVVSLFPSMFQVSSVLLLDYDLVLNSKQWWRPFTAMFAVNHPDTIILCFFMVYISRAYEFHQGSLAYGMNVLLCICISCLPLMLLGYAKGPFAGGHFIVEYALALPCALAIAAIMQNNGVIIWRGKVGGINIPQWYGYAIVLFLSLCHRFSAMSAIASAWGTITGIISALITRNLCGRERCGKKQRQRVRRYE